jgi:hypothetical protein
MIRDLQNGAEIDLNRSEMKTPPRSGTLPVATTHPLLVGGSHGQAAQAE